MTFLKPLFFQGGFIFSNLKAEKFKLIIFEPQIQKHE